MEYQQKTLIDYGLEFTNPELNGFLKYLKSDEFKKEVERWRRLERENPGRPSGKTLNRIIGAPRKEFSVEEELRKMREFDKACDRALRVSKESLNRRIGPGPCYPPGYIDLEAAFKDY